MCCAISSHFTRLCLWLCSQVASHIITWDCRSLSKPYIESTWRQKKVKTMPTDIYLPWTVNRSTIHIGVGIVFQNSQCLLPSPWICVWCVRLGTIWSTMPFSSRNHYYFNHVESYAKSLYVVFFSSCVFAVAHGVRCSLLSCCLVGKNHIWIGGNNKTQR